MVLDDKSSKLCAYGYKFRNWEGEGEEAAEHLGLSHAVIVPANVRTIILSGQVGLLDGGIVPKALPEQVDLAFQHVEKALKAAGLGDDAWEHVYKVTTFEVETPELMDVVITTARRYLRNTKPAWTGVTVSKLFLPGLHLEISVEAHLPPSLE